MSLSGQGDQKKLNNLNLMLKTFPKGPRSARKPATVGDVKGEAELGNKISNAEQKSTVSKSEKLGVPLLGNHFSGNIGDIPIKKRRLLFPSQEPSSMNQEESLSPKPNTSPSDHKEQLVVSKCASGQHLSSSNAMKCENSSKMNASEEKGFGSLKNAKFHWDLNKMTDEWEEPCFDRPPSYPRYCVEAVVDDDVRHNLKMEGSSSKCVASDTEISSNRSDMINFIPLASHTSSLARQNAVSGYSRGQSVDQGYSEDTTRKYFPKTADSQKLIPMYHGKPVTEEVDHDYFHSQKGHDDDKLPSADPQRDICGSEVFQGERRLLADRNITIKVEEGDESPYEEGELRETNVHAGDEKEVEDTENDRVDSELNNEYKQGDDPKTFDGNMFPIEGSLSFSGLHRSGTAYYKRSRFDDYTVGAWRSRKSYGNHFDDYDRRPSGFKSYDHPHYRSYDRRDVYMSPRRQSPTERNDSHGFRRGKEILRGFSRGRSRSGFSSGEFRRGPEERYYESRSHYVERKEGGFSPTFSRGSHPRPHRRSRSRSRSITPTEWSMRRRSLRPSGQHFRSDVQQQGERFPYQRSTSSGDFEQPRGQRWSPKRSSAGDFRFDEHKYMDRPYRDLRSPQPDRRFRKDPRFDSVNYAERQGTRPGRFSQMRGSSLGPRNYDESSDNRRKPGVIYEADKVRRYDTGTGGTGQFGYDAENRIEHYVVREVDRYFRRRDTTSVMIEESGPSGTNEESGPPGTKVEKLTNANLSSPREQEIDGNASTKEA